MHALTYLKISNFRSCHTKAGAIEDALGSSGKGEQAIQRLETDLPAMTPAVIRTDLPEITALLDWFSPPSP